MLITSLENERIKNYIKLKHIIYKKNYNLTWEDLRLEDFNVL